MPFPLTGRAKISHQDLLSFTLDNPRYDINQPVGLPRDVGRYPGFVDQDRLTIRDRPLQVFIDPSDPDLYLSHARSVLLIRRLIAGFHAAGLRSGDSVCIHSFNNIFTPVVVLAIVGADGIFVGANPSYTETELTHILRTANVKFVLSDPELQGPIQSAMRKDGLSTEQNLFVYDHIKTQVSQLNARSWKWLQARGEEDWVRFDDQRRQAQTVAGYFFTSGTTGLPKCAQITHQNLVSQHQLFWEPNPRDYKIRTIHVFPLYHIGVFPTIIVSQLKDGREAYIMRRFDLKPWLSYHSKYNVTEIFMAPPMVVEVVMSNLADPRSASYKYSLRSVRCGYVGAAPLSGHIQKRFHSLLAPGARLTQIWGMTETTSQVTSVTPQHADLTLAGKIDSWGSIGTPLPQVELKLVDAEGNDSTQQGRGEACVRGPSIFRGYLGNEKANRESFDDEGYFKTGDIMEVNPETGLLYVVERQKELIKVRSFQVAPAELEGVLTSHPDIVDAAVVGVPDDRSGELPRAYLVLREGSSLTAAEIKSFMRAQLASYKSLEGGIVFVSEIPKLPSGKILKRVIREWVKKEQSTSNAKL